MMEIRTPLTSHRTAADLVPWVPLGPTRSFKPLRFLREDRGWSQLLRVEPGGVIGRHRHTGEVHAYHLQGQRRLESGEIVGPGDYVYEPAGNVDTWSAVGDEPLVLQATVYGAVEYIDGADNVTQRVTASALYEIYRRHCETHGLPVVDLFE
jgi:anti-sigma factor ChrR (cupin superfamily)